MIRSACNILLITPGAVAVTLLFFLSPLFGQEQDSTNELVQKIATEHAALEKTGQNISGKIIRESFNDEEKDKKSESVITNFYRRNDLVRLEYSFPRKGTDTVTGHPNENLTDLFLRTKKFDYDYSVTASEAIPTADLLKRIRPSHEMDSMIQQLKNYTSALYCIHGVKIIEHLQKGIDSVENKPCNDVNSALWLTGKEEVSETGGKSNWKMALDPNTHYSLLYYEYFAVDPENGLDIFGSIQVTSQQMNDKSLYPKEIINESVMNGKDKTTEKIHLEIISTSVPDEKLFKDNIFEQLGRDYVLVEYDKSQKETGRTLIEAAPDTTRVLDRNAMNRDLRFEWSWPRIIFLTVGILLIFTGAWWKWKSQRNEI